jgi:hypothetical protein
VTGHGKVSGIDVDIEMTFIWRVRNSQFVWGATFFSRQQGVEAIGATEAELEPVD